MAAPLAAGEATEPLKYQTWVLKVSIHCEGCKRTVKKTLQNIDGVYKTTIDSQQHKVTVTGNVSAETLIKKLLKTGKHAELWPENKINNQNSTPNSNNNNNNNNNGGKKNKNKNKNESSEIIENTSEDASKTPKKQNKKPGDTPKNTEDSDSSSTPNEIGNASNGGAKKKKGQKDTGANAGATGGESERALEDVQKVPIANGGGGGGGGGMPLPMYLPPMPPPQPAVAAAPSPAYVMSYNTMHPSASYGTAAYYPMPVQHNGYVFSAYPPAPGAYYVPPAPMISSPSVTHETYQVSDEENASFCSVM
ncbi:hypothetical protein J5N97_008929 [Dioscorea zingiberensis]|uniref:HMA domain-containing protein n=1 Tax=Dioscorea zingiberensis TaxID=325984 RepID=A0A9D5HL78_9LILI|nr:hypothetical protein J5N97_008929 [Dioscorea zingiberensis]